MKRITVHVKVWRQPSASAQGRFETYTVESISTDISFLEMLDILNDKLTLQGIDPIAVESDCREGICGTCGCMINGKAHGPDLGSATCQLHMRKFRDGETILVEPFRVRSFPVVKDLVVDRSAYDRIIAKGGYTSAKTGFHADSNAILVPKPAADEAMDAAQCIGCGACAAACPNGSPSLFVGAKVSQYALLPQGQVERATRVVRMVEQMDSEGFGGCTNIGECRAACPKEISLDKIARMKREYFRALVKG